MSEKQFSFSFAKKQKRRVVGIQSIGPFYTYSYIHPHEKKLYLLPTKKQLGTYKTGP